MKDLLAYLETFHPLSEALKSYLAKNVVPVSFPSRHILLEVPKIASHIYYLSDGFAMSYTLSRDGKVTENFWKKGQIIIAFESFVYQKPSFEVIQLLRPSDLICISFETMSHMLDTVPDANTLYRLILQQHYAQTRKRLRMLKYSDPFSQYQNLLATYPDIERIATQRSIATYLGVTPQTLSRIKREHEK
jgi:CRP-like cAMP-binding protein